MHHEHVGLEHDCGLFPPHHEFVYEDKEDADDCTGGLCCFQCANGPCCADVDGGAGEQQAPSIVEILKQNLLSLAMSNPHTAEGQEAILLATHAYVLARDEEID